eukprot:CAMPEP_0197591804 /NCGR_PEP_ID=MMETSP1326-20131121/13921_1 /TAXON_ID=1155430 /ORGANISM="Genus nov. species nov., Strain RCC2288" /LENGTH=645 /DNA_ID=CAMNT_0043157363 /DNA_START=211 /DNA_END=2148 /DNA_ORIENTATION=-
MTAPSVMTPEERERQTHAADNAVDRDALSRFLAGPAMGLKAAAVQAAAQPTEEENYDPANIQRRRWGVGISIEKPGLELNANNSAAAPAPSWWQKTSWFAGVNPDVAPVLADPCGADGGTPSAGGICRRADPSDPATMANRFVGAGQREPHAPQTAGSVNLNAAAVEDPGEEYGGYNAVTRSAGGGLAFTPVGGAMVHSRLSLQPRVQSVRGPRACDAFEAATRPAAAGAGQQECAFTSAAMRPKYGYDFERGVWKVEGSGDALVVPSREDRATTAAAAAAAADEEEEEADADDEMESDAAAVVDEEEDVTSDDELVTALMETTRGLRIHRFGPKHEALLAATAAKKAEVAHAAAAIRQRLAAAKRAATGSLVPPPRPSPPRSEYQQQVYPQQGAAEEEEGSNDMEAMQTQTQPSAPQQSWQGGWQELRLASGPVVFFGAPDAAPERVAAWIAGTETWPEVRIMTLSRSLRSRMAVPLNAPGPLAADWLVEEAREELRRITAEDAETAAAADATAAATAASDAAIGLAGDADKEVGGNGSATSSGVVRHAPGSNATPQQANIIDQLVNATGASRKALEAADAAGATKGGNGGSSQAKDKEVAALQNKLRDVIREKYDAVVATRAAEARVAALEAALAAAGLPVPA